MGKHADNNLVGESLVKIQPLLNKAFLLRLAEQAGIAFVVAFVGAFSASGNLSTDMVSGALGAGLTAAYGVIVKDSGAALNRPTLK